MQTFTLRLLASIFTLSLAPWALASSPDAWNEFYKEITSECVKASKLLNTKTSHLVSSKPVGKLFEFDDKAALMIEISMPKSKDVTQALCLFDRKTKKVQMSEGIPQNSKGEFRY